MGASETVDIEPMIQGQLQFESVFVVSHIPRACSPASNLDKDHNGRLINTSHVLAYWYIHDYVS